MPSTNSGAGPVLSIRDVSLVYNKGRVDEVTALTRLNLELHQGDFLTIVGSNGAGKSSTVQIISGAARPTTGTVTIDGKVVNTLPDYARANLVARVFDDPRIGSAPDLSIEDNLALAMSRGKRRRLVFALSSNRRSRMRDELARLQLGLENRLHDRVGLLSAGQRQSLTMIMAALTRPKILLLDEHLAALDPVTAVRVLELTQEIASDMGCATIMVTHNMQRAIEVGNRLVVMSQGRVVKEITEPEKSQLTVKNIVSHITGAGDAVTDRILLSESD